MDVVIHIGLPRPAAHGKLHQISGRQFNGSGHRHTAQKQQQRPEPAFPALAGLVHPSAEAEQKRQGTNAVNGQIRAPQNAPVGEPPPIDHHFQKYFIEPAYHAIKDEIEEVLLHFACRGFAAAEPSNCRPVNRVISHIPPCSTIRCAGWLFPRSIIPPPLYYGTVLPVHSFPIRSPLTSFCFWRRCVILKPAGPAGPKGGLS